MAKLILKKWDIARDKHNRRITLEREGDDYTIRIEPASQLDDGSVIYGLNKTAIMEAAAAIRDEK